MRFYLSALVIFLSGLPLHGQSVFFTPPGDLPSDTFACTSYGILRNGLVAVGFGHPAHEMIKPFNGTI